MNASELAEAMEIRASIRRKATSRKSVQENANDRLADQLEQAATMLRQQQAEIEALKLQIHTTLTNRDLRTYDGKTEMNNEPVAWINVEKRRLEWDKPTLWETPTVVKLDRIPLYTHPLKEPNYKFGVDWSKDGNAVTVLKICEDGVAEVVFMDYQEVTHPVKELTDEEIGQLKGEWYRGNYVSFYDLVRAILRKAQE